MTRLTHIDAEGKANMVDVSEKAETERSAVAACLVIMKPETLQLIKEGGAKKGDVLSVARLAGIMAAKRTADLIPLCHPLALSKVSIELNCLDDKPAIEVIASAKLIGRTGVEMEALTAASIAALTIYDMVKAVDRGLTITDLRLVKKTGGKSGTYEAAR